MKEVYKVQGVYAPIVTPFNDNYEVNQDLYLAHAKWLADNNVGIAAFGTNSEANSMSVSEKIQLLHKLVDSGISPNALLPGTGCCALPDSVSLTKTAMEVGAYKVLMLPPFYYKNISDEGVYANFAEIIQQVANENLRIYLYHIPQISHAGFSLSLIEKLLKKFPTTIAGIKDSSGNWSNSFQMINEFKGEGFDVFVGSESLLLQNLRAGGAGCISATANINPAAIDHLYQNWESEEAIDLQSNLDVIRNIYQNLPMISAMKFSLSYFLNQSNWNRVRPPLTPLLISQQNQLLEELQSNHFTISYT